MHSSYKWLIAAFVGVFGLLLYTQWATVAQQLPKPRPMRNPPVRAQATTAPPARPGPAGQPNYNNPPQAAPQQMEQQVLSMIHATNQLEIRVGRMARRKSDSFKIREFGDRLALDHLAADRMIKNYAQKHNIALTGLQGMQQSQQMSPAVQQNIQQMRHNFQQMQQSFQHIQSAESRPRTQQEISALRNDMQQLQQNMPNPQQNVAQMHQNMQQMQQTMNNMQQSFSKLQTAPRTKNMPQMKQMQQSMQQLQQNIQQAQQSMPEQAQNTPMMQQAQKMQQAQQHMEQALNTVRQMQTLQGKAFDQKFVQFEQQGHQHAISQLAKLDKSMPKSKFQSALNKMIPILVQHYQIASTLNIHQAAQGLGGI